MNKKLIIGSIIVLLILTVSFNTLSAADVVEDELSTLNVEQDVIISDVENDGVNEVYSTVEEDILVNCISNNETAYVGDEISFTITVENIGDDNYTNINVTDIMPDGLIYSGYTGQDWIKNNNVFTYNNTLQSGESSSFTITFNTYQSGTFRNVILLDAGIVTSNSTTVYENILGSAVYSSADAHDILVSCISNNETAYVGDEISFIVVIKNIGDENYTNINVTNLMPDGLIYDRYSGDDWIKNDDVFTYTNVLKSGESASYEITFDTTRQGIFRNIILLDSEIVTMNRTRVREANSTVNIIARCVANNESVYVGDKISFTVILENIGTINYTNINVTEIMPEGLIYDSYSGSGWTKNGDVFTYVNTLKSGEDASFEIIFDTTRSGQFSNSVILNSTTVTSNSTIVRDKNITEDILFRSIANNESVPVGEQISFTVIIENIGDTEYDNINITEVIPQGLIYNTYAGNDWVKNGDVFTYTNTLKSGESASYEIIFDTVQPGQYRNVVILDSGRVSSNEVMVYAPTCDIRVKSLDKQVYVGKQTSFEIIVTNTCYSNISDIRVLESDYTGLIYDSYTGNGWEKYDNYFFYLGVLAPGESASFIITFNTTSVGNFTNKVVLFSNLFSNVTSENSTEVIEYSDSNNTTSEVIKAGIGENTGNPIVVLLTSLLLVGLAIIPRREK